MASYPAANISRAAALTEDSWISAQATYVPSPPRTSLPPFALPPSSPKLLSNSYPPVRRTHGIDLVSDTSIAICATYYLHLFLDNPPYHEPLLSALGGLTGIEAHLSKDIDMFKEHGMIPFFIFDGQNMVGQAETTVKNSRLANQKTDEAWEQYFASRAEDAVASFGANGGMHKPSPREGCGDGADEAVTQGRSASRACIPC